MRYFANLRVEWIAESLLIYGFIQRQHIMKKFVVSAPQASNDLREFLKRHKGVAFYNVKSKRYELVKPTRATEKAHG